MQMILKDEEPENLKSRKTRRQCYKLLWKPRRTLGEEEEKCIMLLPECDYVPL